MKAGYLNTQSKQVDWSYNNHWNNKKKNFIKIWLWIYQVQMVTTLNRWSLSIHHNVARLYFAVSCTHDPAGTVSVRRPNLIEKYAWQSDVVVSSVHKYFVIYAGPSGVKVIIFFVSPDSPAHKFLAYKCPMFKFNRELRRTTPHKTPDCPAYRQGRLLSYLSKGRLGWFRSFSKDFYENYKNHYILVSS